ncbi:DUF2917 domain-containing protein [Quatrionicoccus australiensis]|uniref:DUF2917 domain-containing protein n=1 Tax=Quatrionicoccus australiensis TaxID=138118 RepID=UPI001CF97B16|nr:DUF2917 domain-containing protein [Quatrionicoccus australiensis]MCB4361626.1 DUF2917 domain-containing protein [Quatrionicoccus australiensis]
MQNTAQAGEIFVQENRPLQLRGAMTIRCTGGTVWITSAGEKRDIFLSTGQSHYSQNDGLTLIEGIGDGWIRLEKNAPAARWQRIRTAARYLWRKLLSRTGRVASGPGWFA